MDALRRRQKEQEAKVEGLESRMSEFMSVCKARIERVGSALQRLEEFFKTSLQDLKSKHAAVSGRLNERKVADSKIEDLVHRHTQTVQNFEVRVSQLQKVISEQELQLMNSKAALKEAQREIARLKKL